MKRFLLRQAVVAFLLALHGFCQAQVKLTQSQILSALRNHQENADSVQVVTATDTVACDTTTTKITLEVLNDSAAHSFSYRLTFTKDDIELELYNATCNLYRSTFEYASSSFSKLKAKINSYGLKKVDSFDDTYQTKENNILRLYRGDKAYVSVESYNGRTNVAEEFHGLVKEIKKLVPDVSSAASLCLSYEWAAEAVLPDSAGVVLALSEDTLKFKSKGGEFKKVKVTCSTDDWEVLESPEWVTYSRNNNGEIIIESKKNESKTVQKGVVRVGCLGEIKEITIIQA